MHSYLRYVVAAGLLACSTTLASPVEPRLFEQQKNKTAVDSATYDKLVYYIAYNSAASSMAQGPCTKPPHGSVVERYFNNTQTDTQAAIFRSDEAREIVLGIPGTAGDYDYYVTDLSFEPVPYVSPSLATDGGNPATSCLLCTTHVGFLVAWDSIAADVVAGLRNLTAAYPGYSVVVTGTSLGGALAQLAFASVSAAKLPVKYAFTYGQPRVGNAPFADYIDTLAGASDSEPGIYHRVTHSNDGVPQLPPTLLGLFQHSRTEYWESTDPPSLGTTYRCYGQEPSDCNDSQHGVGINAAHGGYAGLGYDCSA